MTAPLDTIKIRLQLLLINHEHLLGKQIVSNLLRNEGVKALWKGNVPAELLYILYGATQFTAYSVFNKSFSRLQESTGFVLSASTHSLVVGCATGVVSSATTYPFDLLRTRLAANNTKTFLSMTALCRSLLKEQGVRGFFVGIKPTLLSMIANSGIFFWSYSLARAAFEDVEKRENVKLWGVEAMSGFTAGVTAKAVTFPLDTLRKRMQVTQTNRATELFVSQLKTGGAASFYRGFTVGLIKTAPTSAVAMAIYEYAITTTSLISESF